MATLTGEITKVRHLLDETDNTDTQFDDTNMIAVWLNAGRRLFARILPEDMLTSLKTEGTLTPSSGVATHPTDYLRKLPNKRVLVDNVFAKEVPPNEMWRLKFLESNNLVKSGSADKYYWETDNAIHVLPTSATTVKYPYLKKPADLSGSDNTDLPPDVDDMVVEYAFERCLNTQRGDTEIALTIARKRGIYLENIKV